MGMGVVDVMLVGQMAPDELPYQALAWAPASVLMVTGIGLLTGVQVLAARATGAGDARRAGGAWRRGLVVAVVAGVLATAVVWSCGARLLTPFGIAPALAEPAAAVANVLVLSIPLHFLYLTTAFFLEAIQRPLASTVAMGAANVVNLVLNLALVPSYGALGSAWATVGARLCLAIALLAWVWRLRDAVALGVRERSQGPSYRQLLGVGAAAAVSHAAESGAFSGLTLIAGRLGATEVSAYQILLNLMAIVFMVALGLSSATSVLTSDAVGRGAAREAGRASFTGLLLNTACMLLIALVVVAAAPWIARAYTVDLTLARTIASLLWLVAVILPPDGGQAVAAAALRARGDNWFPTASHLLAYAAIMPVLAYWLAEHEHLGVTGLMLAILAASIFSCGVLCLRLWHLHRQHQATSIG